MADGGIPPFYNSPVTGFIAGFKVKKKPPDGGIIF